VKSKSKSKLCYDRRSAGQSVLEQSTHLGLRPDLDYCLTVAGLLIWGALSNERTGLSFAIATGPRQRSHFWVNSHSSTLLYPLGTDHAQKTQPLYYCMAQTTQKTRVTCQTASSLVRHEQWAWLGRHRKHNLIYYCVFGSVHRAVARQRVDRIRYNIISCMTSKNTWTFVVLF
jgi:hypothetical protein